MKWGIKYGLDYVNCLYNMVKCYIIVDFKMVCLMDCIDGIDFVVQCFFIFLLVFLEGSFERGWNKLFMFELDFYGLKGNVFFLDLDVVIVDNIDSFFIYFGDFLIIYDWKCFWCIMGNSLVYCFKLGVFLGLMFYFCEYFDEIC